MQERALTLLNVFRMSFCLCFFMQEVYEWKDASNHPNIAEFYGCVCVYLCT
jgi:hypothetical protein